MERCARGSGDADATQSREALEVLCKDYWYPLYAFVRHRGYTSHEAQDLTQAFFADLLHRNPAVTDPKKGKFRSYLLGALKHFLANDWNRNQAQKRGGGQKIIEWDALDPEARYAMEPADQNNADVLFDKRWAMELLARAVEKLRTEFTAKGDAATFAALKGTLTGAEIEREQLAKDLGMTDGALKVAVHRLRQRYREVLRAEIGETVDATSDVDEEMRYLARVLRAG